MKKLFISVSAFIFIWLGAPSQASSQEDDDLYNNVKSKRSASTSNTNAKDSKESAVLNNNAFSGLRLYKIDGEEVEQSAGKHYLNEGPHTIESIFSAAPSGEILTYSSKFNVEKNQYYSIQFIRCDFMDTLNRNLFFNYPYIQIVEKSSQKEIGGMMNSIRLESDSSDSKHLYHGSQLPKEQLTQFNINNDATSITITGKTDDGYHVYYNSYSENKLDLYLKPGWYSYDIRYTNPGIAETSYFLSFKALPDHQIVLNEQNIPMCNQSDFKKLRSVALNDIQFLPDARHGWIVGDDGLILSTKDSGIHWKIADIKEYKKGTFMEEIMKGFTKTNLSVNINSACFIDSANGWIAGDNGLIFRTSDGGSTWSHLQFNHKYDIAQIWFINMNEGFAATKRDIRSMITYFTYTNDGGNTWTDLDKNSKLVTYFLTQIPGLFKLTESELGFSSNKGSSWENIIQLDPKKANPFKDFISYEYPRNLCFIDEKTGWILTNRNIKYTRDKGLTWYEYNLPLSNFIWKDLVGKIFNDVPINMSSIKFSNQNSGYCVGTNGNILVSDDGGKTWIHQEGHTNEYLIDIACIKNMAWIIGRSGGILMTSDSGKNWKFNNVLDFVE